MTHRQRVIGTAGLFVVVAVGAAGCSGVGSKLANTAVKPALHSEAYDASPTAGGSAKSAGANTASTPVDLAAAKRPGGNRQIISTAQLHLQARDTDETVHRASDLVLAAGGSVFSESANLTKGERAHVVFKVPPERFTPVVDGLGRLGKLVDRKIGTDDVTGQVVDLGARLSAAQTSAQRLRELIAKSGNVSDLLGVEQQLTAREGEADSLAGQLATLRAQVDLATVTLDIAPLPRHKAKATHADPGFTRGLRAGVDAFENTMRVTGAGLGFALPFSGIVLVFGLPGWWLLRRRTAAAAPTP